MRKKIQLIGLFFFSLCHSSFAELPELKVLGPLPEEIRKLILEAGVYRKTWTKNYQCKEYAEDLDKYLDKKFSELAKKDSFWKRYRSNWVSLRECHGTTKLGNLKINITSEAHVIVGIEDKLKDAFYFVEPQSDNPQALSIDFDRDGYESTYRNPNKIQFLSSPPSEGTIQIIVYDSRPAYLNSN